MTDSWKAKMKLNAMQKQSFRFKKNSRPRKVSCLQFGTLDVTSTHILTQQKQKKIPRERVVQQEY